MNIRHAENPNLRLHYSPLWYGLPVNVAQGPLIAEYLGGIDNIFWDALVEHPRTLAIRFDLHLPVGQPCQFDGAISRFWDSLRRQIVNDIQRRRRKGKRAHSCTPRYVWARERRISHNPHYHLVLFVNGDSYRSLGPYENQTDCLAARINWAWASALGLTLKEGLGLAHYERNPLYYLNTRESSFPDQYSDCFFWFSYLAKEWTKEYLDGLRNFGGSRCPNLPEHLKGAGKF